jgi:hypothetical protein
MVAGAVVIGLLADQALRIGTFGLAAALAVAGGAVVLAFAAPLVRTESRAIVLLAAVFGAFLAVRASPWLVWPDLVVSAALIGFAASTVVRGSLFDIGSAELAARALHAAAHISAGATFIAQPAIAMRRRLTGLGPVARGLLIAVPICALVSGLLASADPVFASFFNLNFDVGQLTLDVILILIGALAMAGVLRLAAAEPVGRVDGAVWRLGATEALVVLALLDAVFTAFAIAQVMAATGAAADTLRSAGVTYSDYARSGFFQLLWAGGITLVLLIVFSRMTELTGREPRLAFLVLSQTAIALTLMIVVVAFRRLSLYEEAYGFTMLRLYSHIFAVWMSLVFVLLGAEMLGVWRRRRWFVGGAIASGLVVLLALNFVNPEAVVVTLNLNHESSTHKIDTEYLAQLSSDAVPALATSLPSVACRGPRTYEPVPAAFNLSDAQAAEARRTHC